MFKKIESYMSFSLFNPIRVAAFYFIPLLIVSNTVYFSLSGLLVALGVDCLCSLLIMTNSYFDREIDKIAHPNRPMASGKVSVSDAKVFMIFTFIACCIFLVLSKMFLIAFVSILSIIYYFIVCILKHNKKYNNTSLFGLLYTITAPMLAGLFYYIMGYSFLGRNDLLLLAFSASLMLLDLGHDIYGFILDKEGDNLVKIKTIINIFSEKSLIASVFIIDLIAVILLLIYSIKFNNDIVMFTFIPFLMFYIIGLYYGNIKHITKMTRESAILGRMWHQWAPLAVGILLVGAKVKPIYVFMPIAIVLLVMTFKKTQKDAKY